MMGGDGRGEVTNCGLRGKKGREENKGRKMGERTKSGQTKTCLCIYIAKKNVPGLIVVVVVGCVCV